MLGKRTDERNSQHLAPMHTSTAIVSGRRKRQRSGAQCTKLKLAWRGVASSRRVLFYLADKTIPQMVSYCISSLLPPLHPPPSQTAPNRSKQRRISAPHNQGAISAIVIHFVLTATMDDTDQGRRVQIHNIDAIRLPIYLVLTGRPRLTDRPTDRPSERPTD